MKQALVEKVSRERVGDEITKMIQGMFLWWPVFFLELMFSKGRDPLCSVQLICELGLYHTVFSVIPQEIKSQVPPELFQDTSSDAIAAAFILHAFSSTGKLDLPPAHPALLSLIQEDTLFRARLYLASLLLPFQGFTYTDRKEKTHSVLSAVIRESLKLGTQNHYLDGIPVLFAGVPILKDGMRMHENEPMSRAKLGLLLRHKSIHNSLTGSHWSTSILFSLMTDLVPCCNLQGDGFSSEYSHENLFQIKN